ncbi:unnamed protein product [Rhizophagus irregularis]|nr:unnamed protein product [Rhizophagus irregularis]
MRPTSSPLSPASTTPRLNCSNSVSKQFSRPTSMIPFNAPDARIGSEGLYFCRAKGQDMHARCRILMRSTPA